MDGRLRTNLELQVSSENASELAALAADVQRLVERLESDCRIFGTVSSGTADDLHEVRARADRILHAGTQAA
jgi:ElaB/YqjD/DUF883 family membrane-anchored ribosome-binding protein